MFNANAVKEIEKVIGYAFHDKEWLKKAFTHSSYANEKNKKSSYQRLEFLGDSLLDFVIADRLCMDCPQKEEGELSKMRAQIVSKIPLADCIQKTGIEKYLIAGTMGCENVLSDKVRSDLFEAICAAIYRDSGIENAAAFIFKMLAQTIEEAKKGNRCDYKSELIIRAQKENVDFEISCTDIGSARSPKFHAVLQYAQLREEGEGDSKIEAQQCAAKKIYDKIFK